MSKRILTAITLVITVFVLAVCMNAAAVTFDSSDFCYEINEDGETVTLTGYIGNGGDVTVPEMVEYDGKSYTVNSIKHGAFHSCSELISITLPVRSARNILKSSSVPSDTVPPKFRPKRSCLKRMFSFS